MKWQSIILLVLLFLAIFSSQILAKDYRPVLSGNYQQGQKFYTEDEGIADDYYFQEGWLKYKQNLTSTNYYYIKARYYANDYERKDQYDSYTVDLSANYTYQIIQPLKLKTDLRLRNKTYPLEESKNYHAIDTDWRLFYTLNANKFQWGLGIEHEFYPFNNKDNLLSKLILRWDRKINNGFKIHGQYNLQGQFYFEPDALSDRIRHSISFGFEYKL